MAQTYKHFPKDVGIYQQLVKYKKQLTPEIWHTIYSKKQLLPPPGSDLSPEPDLYFQSNISVYLPNLSPKSENPPLPDNKDERTPESPEVKIQATRMEEEYEGHHPLAWFTIFINLIIVSVFIVGFLKLSRTKKVR